jgi:hypothetical protein
MKKFATPKIANIVLLSNNWLGVAKVKPSENRMQHPK